MTDEPKRLYPNIHISRITGLAGVVLILVSYFFLAYPNKVSGDVIPPFKKGEIVFSEKVSYLFSKPQAGDRVIFIPSSFGQEIAVNSPDFIGIITRVNNNQNITTYSVISKDKGRPWEVSRDKIIRKIYYPFLNKEDAINTALSLASTYAPTSPLTQQETKEATNLVSNTASWKTYTSQKKEFSFKYPDNWYFEAIPIYKDGPAASFANEEDFRFLKIGDKAHTWVQKGAKENSQLIVTLNNDQQSFDELKKRLNLDIPITTVKGKQALRYATGIYILLDSAQNRILSLYRPQYPDEGYLDQILSTFKFTE